ncbi:hypothetical protein DWZ40_08965 [Clostridium sp. AF32-12BH]|nr:hypothetical protein DWZ40_08965 [Clostridium sp. AF32-12BH]
MCMKKRYTAIEVEKELQAMREKEGFVGLVETKLVENIVESYKGNHTVGDKVTMYVNPLYIHIPEWQRTCDMGAALKIGTEYNPLVWEAPKILYYNSILICIDGMHRVVGTAKAGFKNIVCDLIECSLEDAIKLFLSQSKNRRKMAQCDYYRAAIESGDENYIALKDICNRYNVAVKGDPIERQVGIFTPISDGIKSIRLNGTGLIDSIVGLITKLQWNGYADTYNGKAYTAKFIRVFHSLYSYYAGREKEMEEILLRECSGTEFFVDNLIDLTQAQAFDRLSGIVRYVMESPLEAKRKEKATKAKAIRAKVN